MREQVFLTSLPASFEPHLKQDILRIFQYDPIIWSAIDDTKWPGWLEFAEDQINFWQPAFFSLFAFSNALPLQNLRSFSFKVPKKWIQEANSALNDLEKGAQTSPDLRSSVLLAFLLRDFRLNRGAWLAVDQFLKGISGNLKIWTTAFVILPKIVPDFDELASCLTNLAGKDEPSSEFFNLVLHAEESSLIPANHRFEFYRSLLRNTSPSLQASAIKALQGRFPIEATRSLANEIISSDINCNSELQQLNLAELYVFSGNTSKAIKLYSKLLDKRFLDLSNALKQASDSVLSVSPNFASVANLRLNGLEQLKAAHPWPEDLSQVEVKKLSLPELEQLSTENPEDPFVYRQLAIKLFEAHATEDALEAAGKALETGINLPEIVIWYIHFPPRSFEIDENIQVIFDALHLQPENEELIIELARLFALKGDQESSKQSLSKLKISASLKPKSVHELIKIYIQLQEPQLASQIVQQHINSLSSETRDPEYLAIVYEYLNQGLSDEAKTVLNSPFIVFDKYEAALAEADIFILQKNYDEAFALVNQVYSTANTLNSLSSKSKCTNKAEVLMRLALLEFLRGDAQNAKEHTNLAKETLPFNTTVYLYQLQLFLSFGDQSHFDFLSKANNGFDFTDKERSLFQTLLDISGFIFSETTAYSALTDTPRTQPRSFIEITACQILMAYWGSIQDAIKNWQTQNFAEAARFFSLSQNLVPENPTRELLYAEFLTDRLLHYQTYSFFSYSRASLLGISDQASEIEHIKLLLQSAARFLPGHLISPALKRSLGVIEKNWGGHSKPDLLATNSRNAAQVLSSSDDIESNKAIAEQYPADLFVQLLMGISFLKNDVEKASSFSLDLTEKFPAEPLAHILAAKCSGDHKESQLEHLLKALALKPDEAAWQAMAAVLLQEKRDYAQATTCIEKAIKANPEKIEYWQILGNIKIDEKNFAGAKEYFEKALTAFPDNVGALQSLAIINEQMNQPQAAMDCLRKAVSLGPSNIQIHEQVLQLLFRNGDYQAVIDEANNILTLSKDNEQALLLKTRVYIKRKIYEEAQHLIQQALNTVPDKVPFRLLLLEIDEAQNSPSTINNAEKLTLDFPKDKRAISAYAGILLKSGRHNEVIALIENSAPDLSEYPDALTILGQSYLQKQAYEKAVDSFQKAININPGTIDAHVGLAEAQIAIGEYEQAVGTYARAIRFFPGKLQLYLAKANFYKDRRNYHEAEETLKEASRLFPADLGLKAQLASVMAINLVNNLQESKKRK